MILIFILFMGKLRPREVQSFGGGRGLTQLVIQEISSKAVVDVLSQDNRVCVDLHINQTPCIKWIMIPEIKCDRP